MCLGFQTGSQCPPLFDNCQAIIHSSFKGWELERIHVTESGGIVPAVEDSASPLLPIYTQLHKPLWNARRKRCLWHIFTAKDILRYPTRCPSKPGFRRYSLPGVPQHALQRNYLDEFAPGRRVSNSDPARARYFGCTCS